VFFAPSSADFSLPILRDTLPFLQSMGDTIEIRGFVLSRPLDRQR